MICVLSLSIVISKLSNKLNKPTPDVKSLYKALNANLSDSHKNIARLSIYIIVSILMANPKNIRILQSCYGLGNRDSLLAINLHSLDKEKRHRDLNSGFKQNSVFKE